MVERQAAAGEIAHAVPLGRGQAPKFGDPGVGDLRCRGCRSRSVDHRQQADSLELLGNLEPGEIGDGRCQIEIPHQCFDAGPGTRSGRATGHDEGNPQQFEFHGLAVAEAAVVEKLVAVVGGDDDERLIQVVSEFKFSDKVSKGIVEKTDLRVVESSQGFEVVGGELGRGTAIGVEVASRAGGEESLILDRRTIRVVRFHEVEIGEVRSGRVAGGVPVEEGGRHRIHSGISLAGISIEEPGRTETL